MLTTNSALIIQIIGAVQATGDKATETEVLRGLHLYMGGVGIQLAFILLFLLFALKFHRILLQSNTGTPAAKSRRATVLLYILYVVLAFIIVSLTRHS
jgi:hypothetical protein